MKTERISRSAYSSRPAVIISSKSKTKMGQRLTLIKPSSRSWVLRLTTLRYTVCGHTADTLITLVSGCAGFRTPSLQYRQWFIWVATIICSAAFCYSCFVTRAGCSMTAWFIGLEHHPSSRHKRSSEEKLTSHTRRAPAAFGPPGCQCQTQSSTTSRDQTGGLNSEYQWINSYY